MVLGNVALEFEKELESGWFDLPFCWYTGVWLATTTGLAISTTFMEGFEARIVGGGGGAAFFLRPGMNREKS